MAFYFLVLSPFSSHELFVKLLNPSFSDFCFNHFYIFKVVTVTNHFVDLEAEKFAELSINKY